jgi:hypothetical protein
MSDSTAIRELLRASPRHPVAAEAARPALEPEAAEERSYANGRVGNRAQVTLVFRKKNGSVRGFSYVHFFAIESDNPAEGFAIEFSQVRVTISGRNLEPLFRLVCAHRIAEICEVESSSLFKTGEHEPVVERIDFRSLKASEGK